MAARDPHTYPDQPGQQLGSLSPGELDARLAEEIGRAERHAGALSCLLLAIENLDELAREHGGELRDQALAYLAGALRGELRRYDRVGRPSERELMIVLPGADGPRGEIVARRVLDRVRAIKVEAGGERMALRFAVGLTTWREGRDAQDMLSGAREATHPRNGANGANAPAGTQPPAASEQDAAHKISKL